MSLKIERYLNNYSWAEKKKLKIIYKAEVQKGNVFNWLDSSKVKCRYQSIIKPKAINYKVDIFYYLSSYNKSLISSY